MNFQIRPVTALKRRSDESGQKAALSLLGCPFPGGDGGQNRNAGLAIFHQCG
jgi:hypothetical protein